jgi:hypothetical protein
MSKIKFEPIPSVETKYEYWLTPGAPLGSKKTPSGSGSAPSGAAPSLSTSAM